MQACLSRLAALAAAIVLAAVALVGSASGGDRHDRP